MYWAFVTCEDGHKVVGKGHYNIKISMKLAVLKIRVMKEGTILA